MTRVLAILLAGLLAGCAAARTDAPPTRSVSGPYVGGTAGAGMAR